MMNKYVRELKTTVLKKLICLNTVINLCEVCLNKSATTKEPTEVATLHELLDVEHKYSL